MLVVFGVIVIAGAPHAQQPAAPGKGSHVDLVQKLLAARRDYQKTLEQLRLHYFQANDMERMRWAEEELKQYHRVPKHAFILDLDVPPPNLKGDLNVTEANKLFTWA